MKRKKETKLQLWECFYFLWASESGDCDNYDLLMQVNQSGVMID